MPDTPAPTAPASQPRPAPAAPPSPRRCPLARYILGETCAPTLVYLHGITSSAVSSSGAIEHWAAAGYRVLALDARGHGLSPRWREEELAEVGTVLLEDLLHTLGELAQERHAALSSV